MKNMQLFPSLLSKSMGRFEVIIYCKGILLPSNGYLKTFVVHACGWCRVSAAMPGVTLAPHAYNSSLPGHWHAPTDVIDCNFLTCLNLFVHFVH